MQTRITYKGTLNGVYGIWCGFKPENAEITEEVTVYYADEGKTFKKGDEYSNIVILSEGEKIEDYEEIEEPKEVEIEVDEEVK